MFSLWSHLYTVVLHHFAGQYRYILVDIDSKIQPSEPSLSPLAMTGNFPIKEPLSSKMIFVCLAGSREGHLKRSGGGSLCFRPDNSPSPENLLSVSLEVITWHDDCAFLLIRINVL